MSEDHKQQLESQLWNIANTLRPRGQVEAGSIHHLGRKRLCGSNLL